MKKQMSQKYYQQLTNRLLVTKYSKEKAMKQLKSAIQAFHRLESHINYQSLSHRLTMGEKYELKQAEKIKGELTDLFILTNENIEYEVEIKPRASKDKK